VGYYDFIAALENIGDSEHVTGLGRTLKRSGKENLFLFELKQHTPWTDKEGLGVLDQRKYAKMQ